MLTKFEPRVINFLEQVDYSLQQKAGVSYSEMQEAYPNSFDQSGEALWRAASLGWHADRFARSIVLMTQLATIDEGALAAEINAKMYFNRMQLALISFAATETMDPAKPDWLISDEGKVYSVQTDGRLYEISTHLNCGDCEYHARCSAAPVGADVIKASTHSAFMRIAAPVVDYNEKVVKGLDIDIILHRLDKEFTPRSQSLLGPRG